MPFCQSHQAHWKDTFCGSWKKASNSIFKRGRVELKRCFNMTPEQDFIETSLDLCQRGDMEELARVYLEILPLLRGYLQNLGASPLEAQTLAAEVLSDCLVGTLSRPPLINKCHGRSTLATWMSAVARNRYHDFMRGQKMDRAIASDLQDALASGEGWVEVHAQDERLFEALRSALIQGFQALSATDAVLLHLVHGHKVDQRILARSLGWSDTKMSRHLSSLRSDLKLKVQSLLRDVDGSEAPSWEELIQVCGQMEETL
ncbi:MAG: sigma-70 family RNA polymerase sigma factor [Proteobacteria bacterium]|nr:sigma-70 family RNA polymerase sigma factor [Pseudomonadota bacterium]